VVDLALDAPNRVEGVGGAPESDFSLRKIKIAGVCLLGTTFATSLLPFMALTFVLLPMTREFHWSREEFLLANSSLMWFGALTVWPLGWLTDKLGARPVILFGTLAVGVVTLAIPYVHNRWEFYGLFALLGVFGSSGASYSKVITSLFTQNRGKAMAIFGAEGTLVRVLIPMLTSLLILSYTWRGMFTAFGIMILAIVPLLYFGLEEPGTRGLKPTLGVRRPPAGQAAGVLAVPFEGMSMGEVMRDWVFWLMLFGGLVSMTVSNGMMANIVAALQDRGFSQQTVAGAQSIATLAGIPGVLLAGFMMDRIQTARIAVPFHLAMAISVFFLMSVTPATGGAPMLIAAQCLFMLAFTSSLPMTYYFLTRFFGLKSYAQVYGFQSAIQAVCMGFAPPVFGHIYDVTHSYTIGFAAQIASALIAAAVFLVMPAYRFSADIGAMPAPSKAVRGAVRGAVPAR
jgi:MFS family permease